VRGLRQAARAMYRLARDVRGVAQVELVIALPALITIFLAVSAVFWLGEARMRAHAEARACAWDFALHACDPEHTRLCTSVATHRGAPEGDTKDFALIAEIPLLGDALLAMFGEPAYAERSYEARVLPGEDRARQGRAHITLVCAPSAESLSERMKGAMCDIAKSALEVDVPGCK
jgi:hypothetical protein